MTCLKQVFTWKCGCTTTQTVHHAEHPKSLGDTCPREHVIHIIQPVRYHHLKNKGMKNETKIECGAGKSLSAQSGGGGDWGSGASGGGGEWGSTDSSTGFGGSSGDWGGGNSGSTTDW